MKHLKIICFSILGSGILILFFFINFFNLSGRSDKNFITRSFSPNAPIEMKKGRAEYFFKMLRDPKTNQIPIGIRSKELAFAEELKKISKSSVKQKTAINLQWKEAGPYDVGGRTRALAIDIKNHYTVIAGGASGGIWKSTDNGESWQLKSTPSQIFGITSIAQDVRKGNTNTWYATTGEWMGSSNDMGHTAYQYGNGVYKSTDNGETWFVLPNTVEGISTRWDSPFDRTSRIAVNPVTGSVFIASDNFGIFRSKDGGNSFQFILGGVNQHAWNDLVISPNGKIAAALSAGSQQAQTPPGIYISTNDGEQWKGYKPDSYPSTPYRGVLAFPPSNDNILYGLIYTGQQNSKNQDIVKFYKFNLANNSFEDRSGNLPDFNYNFNDYIYTQGGYNLTVAVKPDDENFVLIGATSLFRSTNGFAVKPSNAKLDWIGGYHTEAFFYPNLHPDIHSFAFDPTDPNKMWWGHDGGLSYTTDIRTTSYNTYYPWINKNKGYNVTQFYMITIPDAANDDRIMGGTQDNGTPFFRWDGTSASKFKDVSYGDGSYAYFGKNYAYTSSQYGHINRVPYDAAGNLLIEMTSINRINPIGAENQLFVNPFAVDPNDEDVMYYPAGQELWRNNKLSLIPDGQNGTTVGWTKLSNLSVPQDYIISYLIPTKSNPEHVLYYAASSDQNKPKIFKLQNSVTSASGASDISISNAEAGAYAHNIAVNPDDGNELIVVLSNYNITGLYHSENGGQSYTAVEGNLTGDENNPGPSMRAATILPIGQEKIYLVATSIGVFSTTQLNGQNTVWVHEGEQNMGNVVVNYLTSRKSDGTIIAGTHGRGAFISKVSGTGSPIVQVDQAKLEISCQPDNTGSCSFILTNAGGGVMNYSISASGPPLSPLYNSAGKSEVMPKLRINGNTHSFPEIGKEKNNLITSTPSLYHIQGNDILVHDDGNDSPDYFIGFQNASNFAGVNEFDLNDYGFDLDGIQFYYRSENSILCSFYITVYDKELNALWDTYEFPALSQSGNWYEVTIPQKIIFKKGEVFYLSVQTFFSSIQYPLGFDLNGQVAGKSYYIDFSSGNLINMNSIDEYKNGAFLIRAVGTKTTATNSDPVAIASISNTNPKVGETVTFDASQSYDNDGQIVSIQWNFGDGSTSNQKIANHAYTQANNYTYSLTVTDDAGGTDQTSGQISVTQSQNKDPVAIAQVSKTNANINENITFDASQSYDEDGNIISYFWDFGDGSTSTDKTAVHSYAQAATYTFTLKVTDNENAAGQTSGQIIIAEAGNIAPHAIAQLSSSNANINETITFDASQSYDEDGQIISYLWDFGDGNNSTNKIASHSYSAQGTYNYQLTVTDNANDTGKISGQVIISDPNAVQRFTITPSEGSLSTGEQVLIHIDFNSQNLAEGNYSGNIMITGNGGNITIPLEIKISSAVDIQSENNSGIGYTLAQNYPNPFNPATYIEFSIPSSEKVTIKIYDITGREVATLLNEFRNRGKYSIKFNGSKLASGVYIYRIKAGRFSDTKKFVIMK